MAIKDSKDLVVCAGGAAQLPAFWRDDPKGWFINCESQFISKGISASVTKYHYCVAKLDSDTSWWMRDLVQAPVQEDSYNKLKARLCKVFELSDEEKIDKMLETSALEDRKPSDLMAKLIELCPPTPASRCHHICQKDFHAVLAYRSSVCAISSC